MAEQREKGAAKEDSNEASRYQIKSMNAEIESSRARIRHQEEVLEQREDELRASQAKINQSINEAASIKYELKQVDNEICFYEDQNRKHQQAQSQLQKANEYEVCRGKELGLQEADSKVRLQARASELKTLEYDLEQVREHNERLIDTSNAMQDEIEALNKHMNLITGQNYELSSELQRFLQTDEVVKSKLNRRSIVEEIKSKVDTAIRRSQAEV